MESGQAFRASGCKSYKNQPSATGGASCTAKGKDIIRLVATGFDDRQLNKIKVTTCNDDLDDDDSERKTQTNLKLPLIFNYMYM